MYKIITTFTNKEIEITINSREKLTGYGNWDIIFDISDYKLNHKEFKVHTTDCRFIDSIVEFKADNPTADEIDELYFEKFFYKIEESVYEWIENEQI